MSVPLLVAIAAFIFILILVLVQYMKGKRPQTTTNNESSEASSSNQTPNYSARRRRLDAARRRPISRAEPVTPVDQQPIEPGHVSDSGSSPKPTGQSKKIGAKKIAKLQAKAEKRAQREAEEQLRVETQRRQLAEEEVRRRAEQQERDEEAKQLERERLEREATEKRAEEAYRQLADTFTVEEEGFEEEGDGDNEDEDVTKGRVSSIKERITNYVRDQQVVPLEELARNFNLKQTVAIELLTELHENGKLTGFFDRDKFVYTSDEVLQKITKFINQNGRVAVSELVAATSQFIDLKQQQSSSVK